MTDLKGGEVQMELREWKLLKSELTGHVHCSGYVHASSEHGEGDKILTSPVKTISREDDVVLIRTANSVYRCPLKENRTENGKLFQEFGVDIAN